MAKNAMQTVEKKTQAAISVGVCNAHNKAQCNSAVAFTTLLYRTQWASSANSGMQLQMFTVDPN